MVRPNNPHFVPGSNRVERIVWVVQLALAVRAVRMEPLHSRVVARFFAVRPVANTAPAAATPCILRTKAELLNQSEVLYCWL